MTTPTPARITRTPVRPVRVALVCGCGAECEFARSFMSVKSIGDIHWTYEHYCPSCGARHEADRRHPYIDYEPVTVPA